MAKRFKDLSEQEILALAISSEEEDGRIYGTIAEGFKTDYPASAEVFRGMQAEEADHHRWLVDLYRQRFGNQILLIRRQDVRGFIRRRPVWLVKPLGINAVRRQAESMEMEAKRLYEKASQRVSDASTRKLLLDLAEAEGKHAHAADELEARHLTESVKHVEDDAQRRLFVLQVIQPGLAGLMDGSVSTLAPLFAAAFATINSSQTFRVGLAASVGAGISMAFAEALSDDGAITGRGKPLLRGIVCGLMTTAGGIGHTLPYLIPLIFHFASPTEGFKIATSIAGVVVAAELLVISYIRNRYMDTPFLSAAFQVIVGGLLVFLAGILIGVAG
jgi:rubrerythrin